MRKKIALRELQKLVSRCEASILYKPLKGEIDYSNHSFPLKIHANNLTLTNNKGSDPFEWVSKCIAKFKNTKLYILIPGTRFDIHGTRHGKGGGWYDRFLSEIPSTWLRIGITKTSLISPQSLKRQTWDKPVDWLISYDGNIWSAYRTTLSPPHP